MTHLGMNHMTLFVNVLYRAYLEFWNSYHFFFFPVLSLVAPIYKPSTQKAEKEGP